MGFNYAKSLDSSMTCMAIQFTWAKYLAKLCLLCYLLFSLTQNFQRQPEVKAELSLGHHQVKLSAVRDSYWVKCCAQTSFRGSWSLSGVQRWVSSRNVYALLYMKYSESIDTWRLRITWNIVKASTPAWCTLPDCVGHFIGLILTSPIHEYMLNADGLTCGRFIRKTIAKRAPHT